MSVPSLKLLTRVSPIGIPVENYERIVTVGLQIIAPDGAAGLQARPLNLGLVIDKSGSMSEKGKIDTARAAALQVVDALADHDTFTLVAFNQEHEVLVSAAQVGPRRAEIKQKIGNLLATGRTKLAAPLAATFEQLRPHTSAGVTSIVYVLSDGQVEDADLCLPLRDVAQQSGFSIFAGGIGDEYARPFLEQICYDPCHKFLLENIELSKLSSMSTKFTEFLQKDGHVVTRNCRLVVEPCRGAEFLTANVVEPPRPLIIELSKPVALADFGIGVRSELKLEFAVKSQLPGLQNLARFRLLYDLPESGIVGAEVSAAAAVEITDDPNKWVRDPEVTRMVKASKATEMLEKARNQMADQSQDLRKTQPLLQRVTQLLRESGQPEKASDLEAINQTISKDGEAARNNVDRRTTGLLK